MADQDEWKQRLTLRARARLAHEKPDAGAGFLAVLQEAKAIEARPRAEAQDAQFEAEAEEDPFADGRESEDQEGD